MNNEHNNAPAVPQGEPVAWKYELAVRINAEGRGSGWCRRLTDYKPSVPDGMIRNLRPLTYADAAPAVPQGWKLVPVEPSPEMMEAMPGMPAIGAPGDMDLKNKGWSLKAIQNRHRWIAALAATPAPAPAQEFNKSVADAEIKAMYVESQGSDKGWLGIEGSYFIGGVVAARKQKAATAPAQEPSRPQNCGTSYCSCIECVCEPAQGVGLTDETQAQDERRSTHLAASGGAHVG